MRTKPHTIRFDETKLPLALKKANTEKVQLLIDKLIDEFVEAPSKVSKTEKHLPGLTAGMKQIKVQDLNKERHGAKAYNPNDNPIYKIKNKLK
jgi:hypothetical protein